MITIGDIVTHRASGRPGVVIGVETACTAHSNCAGQSAACECVPCGYEISVDFGAVVAVGANEITKATEG
jgi:hypothetical protein